MFSCEACKIFKNIYFEEYLQATASVSWFVHDCSKQESVRESPYRQALRTLFHIDGAKIFQKRATSKSFEAT